MARRKLTIWTEAEAIKMGREAADMLIEIVKTYHGRTAKQSARKNAKPPAHFLIVHPDGDVSVAMFTEKPDDPNTETGPDDVSSVDAAPTAAAT